MNAYVIPFEQLGMRDLESVGGKNASLGEMIGSLAKLGVQVPGGFATTAHAYREFLAQGGLDARIRSELAALDVDDVNALAASGARIRQWILEMPLPPAFNTAVLTALRELSQGRPQLAVADERTATANPARPAPRRRSASSTAPLKAGGSGVARIHWRMRAPLAAS